MAEKSSMDRAFEKRDIYMIMDSEDMDKYLVNKYRYYPATDFEFDGVGHFKFVMFNDTTSMDDLENAMNDATKFSNGFGIGIDVVINVEHPIYELHKDMIDTFVANYNLLDPYFIERRGKPQNKWNHKKSLTSEELQSMFDSCKDERDTFLVSTTFYTAMRVNEFRAFRREWFIVDNGIMIINIPREEGDFKTKTDAGERTIYITDEKAISIIEDWFANHDSYGRSDVTAWARCVAIAEKAGITHRVTPHILRHSGISRWAHDGIPEDLLRKMAGHSDIGITIRHYIHQIKDEIPTHFLKGEQE